MIIMRMSNSFLIKNEYNRKLWVFFSYKYKDSCVLLHEEQSTLSEQEFQTNLLIVADHYQVIWKTVYWENKK